MHDFHVPRWLRNPHLQTLGAAAKRFASPASHPSDELRIPIGEGFHLHGRAWWAGARAGERRTAVVVLHGIGGSSESAYVVRAALALRRAGHHVVRVDMRGAGASIPDVPSLYHAGLSTDLDAVALHLSRDPRVSRVALLGFSGGGSVSLKRAGEWGSAVPAGVAGVVAISAPLDYTVVAPWMDTLRRVPYRFHVLRGLTEGAKAFARHHPSRAHYRPEDVRRMSTFRHYDGTIIVPMHGFRDVDAYYEAASSGPWLSRIEVPTLVVHADDDPMVPGSTVRPSLASASRAVEVEMSAHGGHIGWVSGWDESSWIYGWAMKRALAFLERLG